MSDDNVVAERHSTANRYMPENGQLAVLQKGYWTPISFDSLDYIDCGHIASHRAILSDIKPIDCETYYVSTPDSATPEEKDDFTILTASDSVGVQRHAGRAPMLMFDELLYIDCDHIESHRVALTDDNSTDIACTYYTTATSSITGSDSEIGIATSDDSIQVKYHSSISQHRNKLSQVVGGEYLPLSYDALDYIDCDHVESHREIVTDGDDIGFEFAVGDTCFTSDQYVIHNNEGETLEKLPEWFGTGYYRKKVKELDFINADNGSLGTHQVQHLRVGLNYALAENTLPADDD